MRKKQLFAMLLAGTLTVGMAPASAFAAEEGSTVTIEEGTQEAPAEPTEAPAAPTETPTAPTPETPAEPTEAPATPTPEVTAAPTETPATPTPEATAAPTETPATPTPEVSEGTIVKSEAELNAAIAAAPEGDASSEPVKIILDGDISLTAPVSIPANKNIAIVAAGKDVAISRGTDMKANMFQVEGTLMLQSGTTEDGTAGSITVSGYLDGNKAEGSIVNVTSGVFGMDKSVTLCDNTTTAKGGAIHNAGGKIVLAGGKITGNQAEAGGAVYSESPVQIQGSVQISDNTKLDGTTQDNLALKGENAVLNVSNVLTEDSKIGVNVIDGKEGQKVIQTAEGIDGLTMESVLKVVTYEGSGFTFNTDGTLKAEEPDKPAVTPDVKLKTKPKWLSRTSVEFTCVANVDGWFYAGWSVKGGDAPSFDVSKEGTAIKANEEFKVTLKDLDENNPITAYVLVKDKDNNLSKKRSLDLDETKRPGNTTPTPETTVTPEVSPTATPTPGPTHTPVVPSVKDSVVHGLENPLELWPNVFYSFSVTGAGSDNKNPGEGDAQWVPQYWMQEGGSSKQTTWKIGSKSGIYDEKTLPIRIYLKKYVYNAEKKQWFGTDEIDYITYEVKTAKITPTGTPGAGTNNGGSNTLVADPTGGAGTGSTSSATGAKTSDESPVGSMLMLAFASALAGGYVLVRRRKKEAE